MWCLCHLLARFSYCCRLVRAAGESADPAGAVREVVADMADALRA